MIPNETESAVEQLGAWLIRQPLVPCILVAIVAACLAYSVQEAKWVVVNASYVNSIWPGLLCSAALARSRFRSPTALAYTVCLSLLVSGEWVGGILRPVWQGNSDVLWMMSVRLEALLLRLNGWGAALAKGSVIHDAGFFVFLGAFVLWNAGAWLVWNLVRRQRVWEGLLPVAGLLVVNIHLSGQKPLWLGVFIAAACLLAAYVSYVFVQSDWDRRRVDYPTEVGLTWGISAALVMCFISLATQTALLLGTPAGWHILGEMWRSTEKQTTELASRLFADVNPPRVNTPPPVAQIAIPASVGPTVEVAAAIFPPALQLIGDVPDQSTAVIMWVRTSDPAPLPPELADRVRSAPPPQHYWRTGLFAAYTGRGWEPPQFPPETETSGPELYPAGRYRLFQHFDILASHGEDLFAANLPVTVTAGAQVRYSALGDSALVKGPLSNYDALSLASTAAASELRAAGTNYPPEIRATYLQVPPELPQRVRALADRIAAEAKTPYDKAALIEAYLRANLPYTLKVPPPPPGRDAVDYFLFEAPGGFCTYYASAMAVMLRAEGVPARVASGYAMGTYDFTRGAYKVVGASAHAWVEVYFPAYGWVEFEPTASRSIFDRPETLAPEPTQPPSATSTVKDQPVAPWGLIGGGLGLLLLGAWVVRSWRAREPGWNTARGRARALYRQMRSSLAQAGVSAAGYLTPDEFLAANAAALARYPALRLALAEATRLYLRATFSSHPPASAENGRAQRLWFRAGGDWLRLWWQASRTYWRSNRPGKGAKGAAGERRKPAG